MGMQPRSRALRLKEACRGLLLGLSPGGSFILRACAVHSSVRVLGSLPCFWESYLLRTRGWSRCVCRHLPAGCMCPLALSGVASADRGAGATRPALSRAEPLECLHGPGLGQPAFVQAAFLFFHGVGFSSIVRVPTALAL